VNGAGKVADVHFALLLHRGDGARDLLLGWEIEHRAGGQLGIRKRLAVGDGARQSVPALVNVGLDVGLLRVGRGGEEQQEGKAGASKQAAAFWCGLQM
jgi:hypothetical protein